MVTGARRSDVERQYLIALARAAGGALIFALPMLMTMEMWSLATYMSGLRLALLLVVFFPALVALSHFSGFEPTFELKEDVLDALAAFAVGFIISFLTLLLFGVIRWRTPLAEMAAMATLQAVPASLGALLAQSQLGHRPAEVPEQQGPSAYAGDLFIMAIGALFLAFNLAPTEEMILIAQKMTPWHTAALAVVSVATMHAFVYALEFRGQAEFPEGTTFLPVFLRFSVAGYGIALLISAYILWTFGRTGGLAPHEILAATTVLGFPAATGAAAARLIL
jgi:putative integral membrane protein (TIGR02587 family)